jgi:hypothetical protein
MAMRYPKASVVRVKDLCPRPVLGSHKLLHAFSVATLASDATSLQMIALLKEFSTQVADSDWAVVYYSGHGSNETALTISFLSTPKSHEDSDFETAAIPLDDVMAAIDGTKTQADNAGRLQK